MSQPVLIKAYGQLWPASRDELAVLQGIANEALPQPDMPCVQLNGDLLTISFEGVYFPYEEILQAINAFLKNEQQGKLDILDLEAWTLTRSIFRDGKISTHSSPLNNVLDYSGF